MRTLDRIEKLIVDRLACNEMRLLALLVAVRRAMAGEVFKGDLPRAVDTALKRLVASRTVIDAEGVYFLAPVAGAVAARN